VLAETIYGKADAASIDKLAERGEQLIEACQMQEPVKCTLFDGRGEKIANFVLGHRTGTVDEVWKRSAQGVVLRIEDSTGQIVELALVVSSVQ
jgi:hypothetical protein